MASLRRHDAGEGRLHIVMPQRFLRLWPSCLGDRRVYASRTRFILSRILDQFQQTAWAPAGSATDRLARPTTNVDMRVKMRGMWR